MIRPPDVQVFADDLLEEQAAGHGMIQDLRETELGLLYLGPGGKSQPLVRADNAWG